MLTFDEKEHRYTYDGNHVGSVTQIIGQFLKVGNQYVDVFSGATIPAGVFEAAGEWGTDVHTMIHYYLDDDLDMDILSPALKLALDQFMQWQADYKPEIISYEQRVYSKKYGYAGTLDLNCRIKGKLTVVDYKTGAYGLAGPQIAAYAQADKEESKGGMRRRAVLHFPKNGNGGYKFVPLSGLNDWNFFLSRLNTYNYMGRVS